jgi:hypothetical protein
LKGVRVRGSAAAFQPTGVHDCHDVQCGRLRLYKDLAGVSVVENPETANAPDPGRQSVCQHQPGPFDVSFAAQSATAECE